MDREKKSVVKDKINILVAGGRLQGTEIVYLAKKAGYFVTLVDRSMEAPAAGLADRFISADIFDESEMLEIVQCADCVIPAIEDIEVLDQLGKYCEKTGVAYIFDRAAYLISCSKGKTNSLLNQLGINIPTAFPDCGYPVICKPDSSSGSRGVRKIESEEEFLRLTQGSPDGCVVQQYLSGPSYSLEVLGNGSEAIFPMITEVVTDEAYDCKRIVAPAAVDAALQKEFVQIAEKINSALHIKGIFDIEVVLHDGKLYVLEIDARFPSQTPISIYQSSGVNFAEILIALAEGREIGEYAKQCRTGLRKSCIYQQILVEKDRVKVCGEHIMSDAGCLRLMPGFCGADEMITDYRTGLENWRAIVILTGPDIEETALKWERCLRKIAEVQGYEKMEYIEG